MARRAHGAAGRMYGPMFYEIDGYLPCPDVARRFISINMCFRQAYYVGSSRAAMSGFRNSWRPMRLDERSGKSSRRRYRNPGMWGSESLWRDMSVISTRLTEPDAWGARGALYKFRTSRNGRYVRRYRAPAKYRATDRIQGNIECKGRGAVGIFGNSGHTGGSLGARPPKGSPNIRPSGVNIICDDMIPI